ncbi:hypothetical protein SAMN02910384_03330 [Pseudobutyrivibrio sp. ACV-2]|uniref:hypothetical protein n=1 Tax=Pseudobutyrivibrio sp. ACV-2 TaxID=1520801 RepID=UPI000899A5A8|nr:hypothetical protein [Pseudobutyrivibrio sp. ACV-2]SEB07492.1 hypothetical protein SAMN02910384_03330 [Pseudobutyrivibrio sp. ACV-2]
MKNLLMRIWKWINTLAGRVAVHLLILSGGLIFIACSDIEKSWMIKGQADNVNNILLGIATNLIGIIITVSFVQYAIDKHNEEEMKRQEKDKILRYNSYLEVLVRRYLILYISVFTRLENREKIDIEKVFDYNPGFADLSDLYKTSLLINEGFLKPSIVLYYESEKNVKDFMLQMIENIDFKFYKSIGELLLSFVVKVDDLNMSGEILGNIEVYSSVSSKKRKAMSEVISEYIRDEEKHNWIEKFKKGELNGNIMLPYVVFFYKVQDQVSMISKYKDLIDKLKED